MKLRRSTQQAARYSNARLALATLAALLLGLAACAAPPEPSPTAAGPTYSVIPVTSDLAVGRNRVSFGLVDENFMPVQSATAQVEAIFLPGNETVGEVRQTATATWQEWPPAGSGRGVFVTTLSFDQPGPATAEDPDSWVLRVSTTTASGDRIQAQSPLGVGQRSRSPGIGDPAPPSATPTVNDVADLSAISSAEPPDPDLYQLSIRDALATGKPLVVVFSTPAFCRSGTCGPQVEMLSQVKEQYREQANFIHVEIYQDPHLLKAEPGNNNLVPVPAVDEWGLVTDPWTFVVDREGRVRAKFEQFTTAEEIEAALRETF